jgi:hypothetical protein
MYDIIGDIHGCANKLEGLLGALGYELKSGVHRHPERQAIFVGDLIDRGNDHVTTLEVVRAMVEGESAKIVMGNHEFNAISYATPNPEIPGEYMRPHTDKNRKDHQEFIEQVQVQTGYYARSIEWFRTFPLHLDLGDLRVVHACWNNDALDVVQPLLKPSQSMSADFVVKANQRGTVEYEAIEVLLKGPELDLRSYDQQDFKGPGDRFRHEARIRWWDPDATSLRELSEIPPGAETKSQDVYPDLPEIPCRFNEDRFDYEAGNPILFYGHYWRKWNPQKLRNWIPEKGTDWTENTVCVDFSAVRGGPLVAYRWNGETEVNPENYVGFP